MVPQRFRKGEAAVFKFLPAFGRPDSAPSIELTKPNGDQLQASTLMTMASPTTVGTASPPSSDLRKLNVASVTGFKINDMVYAENSLKQVEYPIVNAIDSVGKDLIMDRDLQNVYDNGNAVAKHEITYGLTGSHTAESGKYFDAKITYQVNGDTYVERVPFHVRNRVFQSSLKNQDLYDVFPDLDQGLLTGDYTPQINAAFERIYMDLESDRLDLDLFRGGFFEQAHLYRTLTIIGERWILNQSGIEEWYAVQVDRYNELYLKLTDRVSYYDANDDDIVDQGEVHRRTGYFGSPSTFEEENPLGWDEDQLKSKTDDFEQY